MVMRHKRAGMSRGVEPGVILQFQPRQIRRLELGCLQNRAPDRLEHERSQFLHARIGPPEQVEATLEQFVLRPVAGGRIAGVVPFARQKQRLERGIESLGLFQPGVPGRNREQRANRYGGGHHAACPSWPGAVNRTRTVASISGVLDRSVATSCRALAGNTASSPGAGVHA